MNALLEEGRSLSGFERHCAFLNTGGPRFANVSSASGLDLIDDGRGIAAVDWDFDGRGDFWVSNRTGPALRLLRNASITGNHFLAVKLVGRSGNRDAVGARLTATIAGESGERRLVKSLRAGEGFVAQSSKWISFGLGELARVDRLEVRWPDGTVDSFADLAAGRFLEITQGGEPAVWEPPRPSVSIAAGKAEAPPETGIARINLAGRLPLPDAGFSRFDGDADRISGLAGQPALINIWATWCAPCLAELKRFAAAEERIRAANLAVLALSVDEIGDSPGADRAAVEAALKQTGFPFLGGIASRELVAVLDSAAKALVDRHNPLPLPCGILLDARGRVAAIYRGPVEVDDLLADVAAIDGSPQERRDHAAHFPGRWFLDPPPEDPTGFARELVAAKDPAGAAEFLRRFEAEASDQPPASRAPGLADSYYAVADGFREKGQLPAAVDAYQRALEFRPGQPRISHDLGVVLFQLRRHAEAAPHFSAALAGDPANQNTRKLCSVALMAAQRFAEAEAHLRDLADADPADGVARLWLAQSLKNQGKSREALPHYREAHALQPESALAANELAWLLGTCADPEVADAAEALRLAEFAARATGRREPAILDTLAAALAASGRFADAEKTAREGAALARDRSQEALAEDLESRAEIYREGKAFLEPAEGGR
ncbi:MAG: ASPIC/UnbV domain-containing protein [Verrucomicrobiales bacterium]